MKRETFEEITRAFDEDVDSTLNAKGIGYASETDRMWNLRGAGKILEVWLQQKFENNDQTVSAAEAAWILSLKHELSIIKILTHPKGVDFATLQEKFGDKSAYNKLSHADLMYNLTGGV